MSDRDVALAETAMASPAVEVSPGLAGVERTQTIEATTGPTTPATHRQLGRYRLDKELGVGGMGIVHAAFDPELERRVALKLILRATSDEARTRLLREARAMARLTHPNIITIYEIGTDQGRDFVAMELCDAGSLADWLRAAPRSPHEILDAFVAAGRGLAAAHEAGIIHRDFKPHNVLRSTSGRIVVGDFGLATGLDGAGVPAGPIPLEAHTALTATGSWVGTPAYMAPEQWHGRTITPATDQFAFCVALWEALAGQRPFRGDTLEALRDAVSAGPDTLAGTALPRRLRGVLKRGLAADPASRWPSMPALLAALRPDRRKLYVFGAAIAGLALSTSVIVLALTRGDTVIEPRPVRPEQPVVRARPEPPRGVEDVRGELARARREIEQAVRETSQLEVLGAIRRMASGDVHAPKDAIARLIAELHDRRTAKLVPASAGGKVIGFKAYAIQPTSILNAIGLSNGDVVAAIDGQPLDSEQALAAVLAELDPENKLELEILRGTERLTIVVATPDEVPPGAMPPPPPPQPPE